MSDILEEHHLQGFKVKVIDLLLLNMKMAHSFDMSGATYPVMRTTSQNTGIQVNGCA
jgi:hypothetical protein